MSPEATDALARLRRAVDGKSNVHAFEKNVLTVGSVEVNPRDIVDLCAALPDSSLAKCLGAGSANAIESVPEINTVGLYVRHVVELIREAERLLQPPAAPEA